MSLWLFSHLYINGFPCIGHPPCQLDFFSTPIIWHQISVPCIDWIWNLTRSQVLYCQTHSSLHFNYLNVMAPVMRQQSQCCAAAAAFDCTTPSRILQEIRLREILIKLRRANFKPTIVIISTKHKWPILLFFQLRPGTEAALVLLQLLVEQME